MQIVTRTLWFINWAIVGAILFVIVLMILRLLADKADLNPFSKTALALRRLTDPLIVPVRGALRGVGVDPRYAPLVLILVTILVGWFLLQLASTIITTVAGMIESVSRGAPVSALGFLLHGLISLYILFIFIRIIFSWGRVGYSNRMMRFLVNVTEPLLSPLRRMLPTLGPMDISPIVAVFILWLFQAAIAGTLIGGFR